jgi:hypothetical protein
MNCLVLRIFQLVLMTLILMYYVINSIAHHIAMGYNGFQCGGYYKAISHRVLTVSSILVDSNLVLCSGFVSIPFQSSVISF